MNIIITGATGSLGAFLTRWFSNKGHEIIAVGRVNTPPENLFKYASYLQRDITNSIQFPMADACIHTAAIADDKANKNELYNANILGTKNVAEAASHCKIFVHISSSSVYLHSNSLLSENMAGENNGEKLSAYGKSKLLAENILIENYKNDACFIFRPRGIYGPGDKVLLPRLLKLVQKNKMIRAGSMKVNLSMTHFENFTNAIERSLQSQKKGLHIYNVADDKTYVLYDVMKKLFSVIYRRELPEKEVPLWILKCMSALKIGDATPLFINTVSKNLALDISKIKRELNYDPAKNIENSLNEIADWVSNVGGIEVVKNADKSLAWEG
ncbi:NAD(P)-dependent oxidoreductase [soil metagenome]